jgi:hypothetical protein
MVKIMGILYAVMWVLVISCALPVTSQDKSVNYCNTLILNAGYNNSPWQGSASRGYFAACNYFSLKVINIFESMVNYGGG